MEQKTISAAQLRAAFEVLGVSLDNVIEAHLSEPKDSDDPYPKPKGSSWRLRLTEVLEGPDVNAIVEYRVTYIPIFLCDPCGKCGDPGCFEWCREEATNADEADDQQ